MKKIIIILILFCGGSLYAITAKWPTKHESQLLAILEREAQTNKGAYEVWARNALTHCKQYQARIASKNEQAMAEKLFITGQLPNLTKLKGSQAFTSCLLEQRLTF